ncbi:nuclear transport factor 2 family protein [Bradyrhizobium sp. Tv2a-2]|uniref:nuclear transport factor 2 family protein n=1 Tax=Bradyrhizobium sp. Tv2a-2 TaxID=113395 RepID=UPI000466E191|nr:nuclear transport factor 2 family protein [Bradyrhizobium sp. Tv2a-2]
MVTISNARVRDRLIGVAAWLAVVAISTLVLVPSNGVRADDRELPHKRPLDETTLGELRGLYKKLIDAENVHDLETVKSMLLASPDSLFISRLEPVEKGEWGGYWGTPSIMEHFAALYSGTFPIDPNFTEEKIVGLSPDVAQTYTPVLITSNYGGQAPIGRHFLMVVEWVLTPDGWRVATDIPMPVPPPPHIQR